MDIKEAKKELMKLENNVEKLCRDFTEKTQIAISGIDFSFIKEIQSDISISYIIKVNAKI